MASAPGSQQAAGSSSRSRSRTRRRRIDLILMLQKNSRSRHLEIIPLLRVQRQRKLKTFRRPLPHSPSSLLPSSRLPFSGSLRHYPVFLPHSRLLSSSIRLFRLRLMSPPAEEEEESADAMFCLDSSAPKNVRQFRT